MKSKLEEITEILKKGEVGIIPTDTIYGIVGSALNQKTVEKIYQIRKRSPNKPFIILISSIDELKKFKIFLDKKTNQFLKKNWPNPLSVILPCDDKQFEYLHRGQKSLAFRLPNNEFLQNLLQLTGPLVAPSANFEGEPPATTLEEAKKYFKDSPDFYIDGGILKSQASTLIKFNPKGKTEILRQGTYQIK